MDENKKIAVVDYQLGNLFSVNQALLNTGANVVITSNPEEIRQADALVLPGVGAFGDAMQNLLLLQIVDPIKEAVAAGKPFFGICLGLQLLFETSEEFGAGDGLGLIPGVVKKFSAGPGEEKLKVPQISWNKIHQANQPWSKSPLSALDDGDFVYFVHSYYVVPSDTNIGLTKTRYGQTEYISGIQRGNIFAVQFHPEKSGQKGLSIYSRWAQQNNLI